MWALMLAYLPAVGLLAAVFAKGETEALWIAVTWMAAFAVAGCLAGFSRCPRCRRFFAIKGAGPGPWGWSNPWTQRCLNCGLPLRPLRLLLSLSHDPSRSWSGCSTVLAHWRAGRIQTAPPPLSSRPFYPAARITPR